MLDANKPLIDCRPGAEVAACSLLIVFEGCLCIVASVFMIAAAASVFVLNPLMWIFCSLKSKSSAPGLGVDQLNIKMPNIDGRN